MKILTPFLCDTFCKGLLKIGCCCSCVKCIKHTSEYINHRSESKVLNAGCNLENFLSSQWTEMFINLFGLFSIGEGFCYKSLAFAPLLLWLCLRVGKDIHYAVNYYGYDSNIAHLRTLIGHLDQNNIKKGLLQNDINNERNDVLRNDKITQLNNVLQEATKINSEAKYLFELLINHGQISRLFTDFSVDRMLEAGVQGSFLQNAINNEQNITLRNNMATQLNNALRSVQTSRLQDALRVVLREATAHPNMLRDVIDAQHNAGQDAALQALQNAIAHVMHGPVVP